MDNWSDEMLMFLALLFASVTAGFVVLFIFRVLLDFLQMIMRATQRVFGFFR